MIWDSLNVWCYTKVNAKRVLLMHPGLYINIWFDPKTNFHKIFVEKIIFTNDNIYPWQNYLLIETSHTHKKIYLFSLTKLNFNITFCILWNQFFSFGLTYIVWHFVILSFICLCFWGYKNDKKLTLLFI